jgi:hypothetical protein
MQTPGEFHCKLSSSINPRDLLPLLPEKAVPVLAALDFEQPPHLELTASGPEPDLNTCNVNGELKLGRTRIHGIPLNAAATRLRITGRALFCEQFKVDRDEGSATGTFVYDFGKQEVRLDKVKTNLTPVDAAGWIDKDLVRNVTPYRFKTPPALELDGVVQIHGSVNTNLEVLVDSPAGMDYTFLKKNLSAKKVSGRLLFVKDRLQISNVVATLYGGRLLGSADISLKKEAPGHTAKIQVEDVDFPMLTKLYFNYDTSQGALSGSYDFSGRGDDLRAMQGSGKLSVVNGDVFAIPVFGPFSGILNAIVPGMGYNVARQASASFEVSNGVLETTDFNVKGQGFEMLGNGKLSFPDDKINFNIRINAAGLPGVLLFPVSKLFEYSSDGPISKPSWHSARLP